MRLRHSFLGTAARLSLAAVLIGAMLTPQAVQATTPSNAPTQADVTRVLDRIDSANTNIEAMLAKFNAKACFTESEMRLWMANFDQALDAIDELQSELDPLIKARLLNKSNTLFSLLAADATAITKSRKKLTVCSAALTPLSNVDSNGGANPGGGSPTPAPTPSPGPSPSPTPGPSPTPTSTSWGGSSSSTGGFDCSKLRFIKATAEDYKGCADAGAAKTVTITSGWSGRAVGAPLVTLEVPPKPSGPGKPSTTLECSPSNLAKLSIAERARCAGLLGGQ